ncbi:hypothetical protein ACFE04_003181 [Oxalis oulophora]
MGELNENLQITQYSVKQTIELVSSLISLTYIVKVFAVKWQVLRARLEELKTSLIAIDNNNCKRNPALSTLMPSILAAINESHDLAKRCVSLSYSGKLLMQSDLDLMSSKFNGLLEELSGIYKAEILNQGFAIIVSKPGINACKDDMRFYVRDLLTRMKIGDLDMKKQALVNLHDLILEDERYVKIIIEVNEVISVLLNFMSSMDNEFLQQDAAKVVFLMSGFDSLKGVLVAAGIIGPLIRVLECGNDFAKEAAAKSLEKLTDNSDNAWSVSAHGGVTALLNICSSIDSKCGLIGPACGILRNLIAVEEIKRFMIEEGAISTFITLAKSKDEVTQINSIEFLQNISSGDESVKHIIIKEGAIATLVQILDSRTSTSAKIRETGLRAIEKLCFSSPKNIDMLISYGFLDHLSYFLRNGDVSVQELALKISFKLCGTSDEIKKTMGDMGFMQSFVSLLSAKSFEMRGMAAESLSSMLILPRSRKKFAQDDRNIGYLLQSLDLEDGNSNSGNKKLLISILMILTRCNSARRKMANSGYLKNIEKIADAEVSSSDDAKRLVKKLSTSRFRTMLSGIWHS